MRGALWIIPVGLLGFTLVTVPMTLVDGRGTPRYFELKQSVERARKNNAQLEREIANLQSEIELLRNDARAIERLARDELGMVREGEIVFQFPN